MKIDMHDVKVATISAIVTAIATAVVAAHIACLVLK